MNSVFRAYDIRGTYPDEINEDLAFKVGKAAALYLNAKKLVVGMDARTSSNSLMHQVIAGITSTGCNVVCIGDTTTPLFNFCVNSFVADGGIMVTASHNPAKYNGLKIVGREGVPISRDSGLKEIESMLETPVAEGVAKGSVDFQKLIDDYINFLIELSGAKDEDFGRMRIVVDASNGMTSLELKNLFKKINVNVIPMFFDIDGTFPNHSPDTSQADNLKLLQKKVIEVQADLGVAFDGDGDRIAMVDNRGEIIWPDHILALLYEYMGQPKTVYDLRISRTIKRLIGSNGIPSPVGYVNIKKRMREEGAVLGGELSGHFTFKEMHYAEAAVLVMLKIMGMMNWSRKPISGLVEPLREYAHSGEIRIEGPKNAQNIIQTLKERYSDGDVSELDGVTVDYPDWWFNLRPSNTEPILRLVIEADTQELMLQKRDELLGLIAN